MISKLISWWLQTLIRLTLNSQNIKKDCLLKWYCVYLALLLLLSFAEGSSGYFPTIWQCSVYWFLFFTSLWRTKWKWFFPMLFRIFLNRPIQQKVCTAIIKFASGQSSLTFSGAYKVLHSGLLKYFCSCYRTTLWQHYLIHHRNILLTILPSDSLCAGDQCI